MTSTASTPYDRLTALGLELPGVPEPIGRFVTFVEAEPFIYLSGQGPRRKDGHMFCGKVGRDVTVADAYAHARLTGLNLISVIEAALGDLARVTRIVKLLGFVNAVPEFAEHPAVINGCSDLFCDVFGDIGSHARSAIGVGSLPGNISVEVEAVIAYRP